MFDLEVGFDSGTSHNESPGLQPLLYQVLYLVAQTAILTHSTNSIQTFLDHLGKTRVGFQVLQVQVRLRKTTDVPTGRRQYIHESTIHRCAGAVIIRDKLPHQVEAGDADCLQQLDCRWIVIH